MADRVALAHLLRRATFGPRAEEVDAAEKAGYGATVDALMAVSTPDGGAARMPPPKLDADPFVALPKGATLDTILQAQQARSIQVRAVVQLLLDLMVAA